MKSKISQFERMTATPVANLAPRRPFMSASFVLDNILRYEGKASLAFELSFFPALWLLVRFLRKLPDETGMIG